MRKPKAIKTKKRKKEEQKTSFFLESQTGLMGCGSAGSANASNASQCPLKIEILFVGLVNSASL
jgi:hypothetical protein